MKKTLTFRFDVDTEKCLKVGVPNLLKLADSHSVKFSFFINMGRAVSLVDSLQGIFKSQNSSMSQEAKMLSAFSKLGLKDYLRTAFVNPHVGKKNVRIVREIVNSGHEVGLHGGRNHALWAKNLDSWSKIKIENELEWGLEQLKASGIRKILGFSSPMWTTSKLLRKSLLTLGFEYNADEHGKYKKDIKKYNNLYSIPTNILGEPKGVGFFEYCFASNFSSKETLKYFKKLLLRNNTAICYDHPYYSGLNSLELISECIHIAKENKYKIVTLKELLNNEK